MFQFGLRSMLFLTLSSAALFAVAFAIPPNVGVPLINSATRLLIPFFVAGIVYGRTYARAFCIGGLSWFILPLLVDLPPYIHTNWVFGTGPAFSNSFLGSSPDLMSCLQRLFMLGLSGVVALVVRYLAQPKPCETEPTVEGAPSAPRDRLPSWLIPLLVLLLLIGGMIGWVALEPQGFNSQFSGGQPGVPPGFFGPSPINLPPSY